MIQGGYYNREYRIHSRKICFFDGEHVTLKPVTAHIVYFVIKGKKKFESSINIPFSEYEKMNHADLIEFIKNELVELGLNA